MPNGHPPKLRELRATCQDWSRDSLALQVRDGTHERMTRFRVLRDGKDHASATFVGVNATQLRRMAEWMIQRADEIEGTQPAPQDLGPEII